MRVGQLLIGLGIQVDRRSFRAAEGAIGSMRRSMAGAAIGMAGYFGAKFLGKALIGFNMKVEDSKNQIAAMLALGGQTPLTAQLENANKLYDMLRTKAADLPGETQDYVNMLQLLAQPLSRARMSLEAMRDITSGSFVMAKGMGISWQEAARDLRDFINQGKLTTRDKFLLGMLEGTGLDATDAGRAKAKALGNKGRAALMEKQTTGPLAQAVTERLSKSFSGRLENLRDQAKKIMGKIGEGLFDALKPVLTNLSAWLKDNSKAIEAFAKNLGTKLVGAFNTLKDGFLWLVRNKELVIDAVWGLIGVFTALTLRATLAWIAISWPYLLGAAIFAGLIKLYRKLKDVVGDTAAVFVTLAAAFAVKKILDMVGATKAMTTALWGQARATAAVAAAQGAGAAGGLAGAAGGMFAAKGALGPATGALMTGAQLAAAQAAAKQNAAYRAVLGATPSMISAAAAGGQAMQPGAKKAGIMGAAKAMGSAVAAAAGPIGWTILAASFLSEMTGGDFIDQAVAKGYKGSNLFEGLQYLHRTKNGKEGGNVVNITVGAPNVDITTQDAKGTAQALADTVTDTVDIQLREAIRNLGKK